jgi:uncharacterized cupredoxin-like copper-binding protein
MNRAIPRIFAGASATVLLLAACTGGGSSPSAAAGDGDAGDATNVAVTLGEWEVVPAAESAPAGEVVFTVTNDGPDDIHEFVVIRTDLGMGDLPVDENGVVDEEGEGIQVIGEIEDLPVGETDELSLTLEAGSYALICNIWSEDEGEAHYAMGMRAAFSATE